MKKTKKFNIIETGRICSPEEMKNLTGGCSSVQSCTLDLPFQSCGSDGITAKYFSCGFAGGYGHVCDSPGDFNTTCGSGVSYNVCGTVAGHSLSCGSQETYTV